MAAVFNNCEGVPTVAAPDYKGFTSQRWREGLVRGEQLYFCLSTVKDIPRSSLLRRQNEDLVKTYAIVLDDCGTKVPLPAVEPTWIMESSPGNFQYGYRLSPAADPPEAAALIEALKNAGHTDPGAGGANRVMRTPGSLNAKQQHNGWRARVAQWSPQLAYSLADISRLFSVTPGAAAVKSAVPERPEKNPQPDPVFDWLLGHGHVKDGPNPRGWYQITCPWENDHQTPPYDHGTDYAPGTPAGAFKCLHGSCERKDTAALKAWIEETDKDADIGVISKELVASLGLALQGALKLTGSLRERMAAQVRTAALGPWRLPDPTLTATGAVSSRQTATEVRVEHVLRLIGAQVRHNCMNGGVQIVLKNYCSDFDNSDAGLATILHACDLCGMSNAALVRQAVVNIALTNQFNPAEDWMLSQPWDGVDRLPALAATLEMRDKALDAWKLAALRRWCLQVVAAVTNYKLDDAAKQIGFVLVLQGPQGTGKSSWIKSLMPEQFVTLGLSLRLDRSEKDSVSRATLAPIGELAELDSSFAHSSISALKNFLTTPVDAYRPPYGPRTIKIPRGTAFAASINPSTFLHDVTGARRFWVLATKRCAYAHTIDVQQLWAQMYHLRVSKGEQYHLTPEEEAMQQNVAAEHEVENEISDIVHDLMRRRDVMKPGEKMVLANMKTLLARYNVRFMKVNSSDLSAALDRAGFDKGASCGVRGYKVPNFNAPLTEAQMSGLRVVVDNER